MKQTITCVYVCGYETVYWRPVWLITFLSLSSCFPWLWWSVPSSTNDLGFGLVSDPIVTDCSALELTDWGWRRTGHALDHMIQFSPMDLHVIDNNFFYFIRITLRHTLGSVFGGRWAGSGIGNQNMNKPWVCLALESMHPEDADIPGSNIRLWNRWERWNRCIYRQITHISNMFSPKLGRIKERRMYSILYLE